MSVTHTSEEIRALMNLCQTGMFLNAMSNSELAFAFHKGAFRALHSLVQGSGKKALAFNNSKGGYPQQAVFKGAWSPLPNGFENFTLAEVAQHLRAHGIKFSDEPVSDLQSNAVVKLEQHVSTGFDGHDEHGSVSADVGNSSVKHDASHLNRAIVQQGGAQ
jgi:hypothetical protein